MSECRMNMNIWWHLFRSDRNSLRLRDVKDKYFWHDSFGKYINQYIVCPIFGHRKVQYIEDDCQGSSGYHCFKCEQKVDPEYDRVRK